MVRSLLFIPFIFLIQFHSSAQKLRPGNYITVKKDIGFTSEYFRFFEDSTFHYILVGCTGEDYGKGKWSFPKKDSLLLTFSDFSIFPATSDLTFIEGKGSKIELDITVSDYYENSPLDGVAILLAGDSIPLGIFTEKNGKANNVFPKFREPNLLELQYMGFSTLRIPIPPNIKKIKGTVKLSRFWLYEEGRTKGFNLRKIGETKIIASKGAGIRVKYIHVSDKKFLNRFHKSGRNPSKEFYIENFIKKKN